MATKASQRGTLPFHSTDLRGLSRLGTDAVVGVTNLVEAMHHTIASGTGIVGKSPEGGTRGITGLVYRSVRGGARLVGKGLDAATALIGSAPPAGASTPEREAMVAALNGIFGDHLVATDNPLAIPMRFRVAGRPLELSGPESLSIQLPAASGKLLVMVHGLCMNDLQWARQGHDHGAMLARELGFTAVHLHYNSGRHVSQNGRDFAVLLDRLVAQWPVPIDQLVIVGHSMGGLVARSACHVAQQSGMAWPQKLRKLVFLGTPHHGAPLERGGRFVDTLLGVSPYVAPFARLGKARSAGITDLRYGNLQDADWQAPDGKDRRHDQKHDDRQPMPLPEGVDAFVVAATSADQQRALRSTVIGDGLVPLASALGDHRDPALALNVPAQRRLVITSANHWDLLNRSEVADKLREWLA